jgi:hypothetical protein
MYQKAMVQVVFYHCGFPLSGSMLMIEGLMSIAFKNTQVHEASLAQSSETERVIPHKRHPRPCKTSEIWISENLDQRIDEAPKTFLALLTHLRLLYLQEILDPFLMSDTTIFMLLHCFFHKVLHGGKACGDCGVYLLA